MSFYLGIDLGTSSVKSLLMEAGGTVVGSEQEGYDIIKKTSRYAEQDIENLWGATVCTLRRLVARYPGETGNIKGISFSGQMHGLVMIDRDKAPVREAIIWADQRSHKERETVYQILGEGHYKSKVLNSLSTGFMLSSLMWVREHEPENYRRIYKIMFPKDYIRYKMCGEIGTDQSDASGGGIFDLRQREWAWDFMDMLDLNREMFPVCHESGEPAGVLTKRCARETGLPAGILIAYGGGDTLMQGLGNGAVKEGILTANIGTSCQIGAPCRRPLFDPVFRMNTFCHVHRDLWLLMGAHLSGGVALKWLKNQIFHLSSYDEMTALASKVPPGSEGVLFLPYLSGERTPYNNPKAKGIYFGLNLSHGREHFLRSAMEGIVFCLRSSMDILEEMGVSYHRVIASGGGARSRLFLQMQADIFDCEIYTSTSGEQACLGAAMTAAVTGGEYSDYENACAEIVRLNEEVLTPNREHQKLYQEQYVIYKELYHKNEELFHKSSFPVESQRKYS